MCLKNPAYRQKLAQTIGTLSQHELSLVLSLNCLSTFGDTDELRERLRQAASEVI
jgi:hypothetical protein